MLCGVLTMDRDEKPSSYEIVCEEATVSVGVTLRLQNSHACLHFYEVEAFGESSVGKITRILSLFCQCRDFCL